MGAGVGPISEDCLVLNVWTRGLNDGGKRPVMVWIHPGGYQTGSGSTPGFDGEGLAKKGVVLVTINYRLGVLGFFSHPELTKESEHHASSNYGLMDQIAVLIESVCSIRDNDLRLIQGK